MIWCRFKCPPLAARYDHVCGRLRPARRCLLHAIWARYRSWAPAVCLSTYFVLSSHSVKAQLPAARLPARRTFHRPTVPAIPLWEGRFEKESPIFPGSYAQNEINKNKRLGSLFLNFLSLHHSAREERLLREKKPWKKKGLMRVKRWNRKKRKEKKLQKVFGSSEKISTFAVPTETEGKQKKIKRAWCHRNIADTEVEAQKVL